MAEWLTQQIPVPEERQCCKEKMKSETRWPGLGADTPVC